MPTSYQSTDPTHTTNTTKTSNTTRAHSSQNSNKAMHPAQTSFAEVIESSLQHWKAQCWQWDAFPLFGSLIRIKQQNKTIFGIVHQVNTGSMDPTRYPFPYQKTEEELMREQPQIFEFLKTTFSCITIGYTYMGKVRYLLADTPPKIHAFVEYANIDECKEFFASTNYLHVLFGLSGQIFNLEELLLAIIQYQVKLHIYTPDNKKEKIHKFIETFSLLVGNDYRRLKLFLQRVEPLLER